MKNSFSTDLYAIIRPYLLHRTFRIKYGIVTQLKEINSRVPQGIGTSRIKTRTYICYTPLIFQIRVLGSTIATYADDTAILVAHNNHIEAFL